MSIRASLALWLLTLGMLLPVGRADSSADEVERLRQEVKSLKETVAVQQKQIAELREVKRLQQELLESNQKLLQQQKEAQQLRDRAVAAEIQAATLKRRNDQLVEELDKTIKEMRKLKEDKPAAPPTRNAPGPFLEGMVKSVDPSGLVKINLGSDAGLQRGQTLELFRLDTDPKKSRYLGTLRIVEVTATEATGQPVGKMPGGIQVGDRVASRIEPEARK